MNRTPCVNQCMMYCCYVLTERFLCHLWWTFCDGLYCHTVRIESVTFFCIFKYCWAMTESCRNVSGGLESPGKVRKVSVSKRMVTLTLFARLEILIPWNTNPAECHLSQCSITDDNVIILYLAEVSEFCAGEHCHVRTSKDDTGDYAARRTLIVASIVCLCFMTAEAIG